MLDINVTGTFLVAQATANEMLRTNTTGSMVFVASMSGHVSNKVSINIHPEGTPHIPSLPSAKQSLGRRYSWIQLVQSSSPPAYALASC